MDIVSNAVLKKVTFANNGVKVVLIFYFFSFWDHFFISFSPVLFSFQSSKDIFTWIIVFSFFKNNIQLLLPFTLGNIETERGWKNSLIFI